jgi:hypothetical protein
MSPKLTPAQTAQLLDALRVHPAAHRPRARAVARRLVAAGLFKAEPSKSDSDFALTAEGMDQAARLSAQRVIDAVNSGRAERESGRKERGAALSHNPLAPDTSSPPSAAAGGRPPNWPFPVSAHDWN